MNPNLPLQLLGGLSPRRFLEEFWQRKPLLIRNAVPGFAGLLSREELFAAARRDDVESRLITRAAGDWDLRSGPFATKDFRRRKEPWTVLVQGLNLLLPEADALMRQFAFIPQARLDDVMVSWASDGGGVGPHFDSYDVFLLQGTGKRHWRIGAQRDQTLVDGLPIRILKNFTPSREWTLEPGDMLYLPPQYAHDGVAVGECTTYSVGFRTSPTQELAEGFLSFLQDQLCLSGRYADPGLKPARHSAEIAPEMVEQVAEKLEAIRWNRATVRDFLGAFLTEPKPHVFFDPPHPPLSRARFLQAAAKRGVRLDLRSQLLFAGSHFYLNGELVSGVAARDRKALRQLADQRELADLAGLGEKGVDLIYDAYCDGFLELR